MIEQPESVEKKALVPSIQEHVALPTGQKAVLYKLIAEGVQLGEPILVRRSRFEPKGIEGITQLSGVAQPTLNGKSD